MCNDEAHLSAHYLRKQFVCKGGDTIWRCRGPRLWNVSALLMRFKLVIKDISSPLRSGKYPVLYLSRSSSNEIVCPAFIRVRPASTCTFRASLALTRHLKPTTRKEASWSTQSKCPHLGARSQEVRPLLPRSSSKVGSQDGMPKSRALRASRLVVLHECFQRKSMTSSQWGIYKCFRCGLA